MIFFEITRGIFLEFTWCWPYHLTTANLYIERHNVFADNFPPVHFSRVSYPVGLGGITLFDDTDWYLTLSSASKKSADLTDVSLLWTENYWADSWVTFPLLHKRHKQRSKRLSTTLFCRPPLKSTRHRSHQWSIRKKKGTAMVGSYRSRIHTDKFCWSTQLSPISIKPTFLLVLILGSKRSKEVFLQIGIIKDL